VTQTTATTWQLDPQVRFRRLFDEAVVIHQQKAEALVLNETGVSFLELCDGQRTLDQIIDLLDEEYDTPRAELTDDVLRFAEELSSSGIISPVTEPAS
jgi:pyrroloquinoline quinone biosynthesis protein D